MTREDVLYELTGLLKPLRGGDTSKYNKAVHAANNVLYPKLKRWVKEEVKKAEARLKDGAKATSGEGFEKFLDTPMTEEERHEHIRAAIDFALSTGADVKELEVLSNKLGLSEERPEPIQVVNFADAVEQWEGLR